MLKELGVIGGACVAACAMVVFAGSQETGETKIDAAAVGREAAELLDEMMYANGEGAADLLILGTFHFQDAGLDEYKPRFQLDVMSEQRQAEIAEIVRRLAEWGPTRVCVERKPDQQEALDERYEAYLAGEWELPENEIYQLGFRVAEAMGHERVYPVDADGRWYEPRPNPVEWAQAHGQAERLQSAWMERFMATAEHFDRKKVERPLRKTLLMMNSEAAVRAYHAPYLVGPFAVGDEENYPGVDGFLTSWYNRNLRIVANMVRLIESDDERLLLIIGAGHGPIIRHAVESSPEFEVNSLAGVLGD